VSGLDIVREQLSLAAGRPLSPEALEAAARAAEPASHAIEVRITAEDPARDFSPAPGRVRRWVMPAGPGVRVDSAVEAGERIPPEYDNLVAKIMVHAADREAAIGRLRRALDETEIAGIQTTLPFHRFVARDPSFAAGELSTGWVGERWDGVSALAEATRVAQLAAGLDALDTGLATAAETVGLGSRLAVQSSTIPSDSSDGRWASAGRLAATDRRPR
jgi:acetyl/propionyl-CoA carboxylase alpha subunit